MTEIEKLRKELNNALDAFENKPKHEIGKWYWAKSGSLFFIENIDKDKCYGYGLNWANNWIIGDVCDVEYITRIATDDEVTEMLTKEAIKRGFVEGASVDLRNINELYYRKNSFKTSKYETIENGFSLDDVFIMQNGIWATVVKERSYVDWYRDFIDSPLYLSEFIKSTKTELIEILKNLDNE